MTHLRSPSVHHLGISPWALHRFADGRKRSKATAFVGPYARPSLNLFNAHCARIIADFELAKLHLQDRAVDCSVACDGISIRLQTGSTLVADHLVLAIGASEQPAWPDWAPRNHPRVQHIFDPQTRDRPSCREAVAVIGGGISASQVALRLMHEDHQVTVVSRHVLRQHAFDSDPGWLGPKHMVDFVREANFDRRRARIDEARYRGSVPPEVWHAVRGAVLRGQLAWHTDVVEAMAVAETGLRLRLQEHGELEVDRVLLATGFESQRPGGAMVDSLIASASLPCAGCGYPVVDTRLRWHPRIYVSGPLAELELGPTSRNIAGARHAADRVIAAIRDEAGMESKVS